MADIVSFGYWVRRRRRQLDLTQANLARLVSCSLSMLRKIEYDERRPSRSLAGLLADHLAIEESQRDAFLQMARGHFVANRPKPREMEVSLFPTEAGLDQADEDRPTFVGRERQLKQLHQHLDKALDGQGQMVFVLGEAGQGKTSLLLEFARQAMTIRPDLLVAGGRSDISADLGDPLLPFRDILRLLVGDVENAGMRALIRQDLVDRLGRALPVTLDVLLNHGPHLFETLIPLAPLEARLSRGFPPQLDRQLGGRLRALQAKHSTATALERHQDRLFEEISTTFSALAHRQPLLLLLDDLHWADMSSLGLLGHLALRLRRSPILMVASFRPEDLLQKQQAAGQDQQRVHPLSDLLHESQRQFGRNRIDLNRAAGEEALEFINALLSAEGMVIDDRFAERLARLTGGHPLFAIELLRDMKERGDLIQHDGGQWRQGESLTWERFPARVEGVIEKRVGRLEPGLLDLLTVGSVQGETFYAEVIAQVRRAEVEQVTHWLSADLDRQHRLVREEGVRPVAGGRLSQYRFRHQLIQKYLYGRLAEAERSYLHEAVGQALEAQLVDRVQTSELPAAQLAHHFEQAHSRVKAATYWLQAGQNAVRVIAYDEAAAHFERGLAGLAALAGDREIDRLAFELTLALASASWNSGRVAVAFSTAEKAVEIARLLEDPVALARAALAYDGPSWRLGVSRASSEQYAREALLAFEDEESGLRVRLLVNLARILMASSEEEELRETVERAIQMARRVGDSVALYDALRISAQIDRRPANTFVRLEAVDELIATARAIGDQERLADALDLYIYDHLELGHIELVDEAIAAQRRVVEEIRQPFQLHVAATFRTMRAILRGDFAAAARLANEAADLSQQIGVAEFDGILGVQMFTIRREQGRLPEVASLLKLLIANTPASASWQPGLALLYCTLDQREECRAVFEALAVDDFAAVPKDSLWAGALAYLSEVCAYLGDARRAERLYELLLPYDGRTVVVGAATVCFGAAARYLGLLATTMAAWTAAERHFEEALALDAQIGARPWLAHTQYQNAAMLLTRGRATDLSRADALLADALATAQELELGLLADQVAQLKARFEIA
ncbi:MAG: AAA family ATPase [Candidatus Promineifilaceae bacterium]|nr:AAA family ATPase [Candidatus Promineifilaceae bacterium]